MKTKSTVIKITNITLGLVSGYYVFDSVFYMWEVFSSIYHQTGLVASIFSFSLTSFIINYGFMFLLSPLLHLIYLNIKRWKTLVENIMNFLFGLVLIQFCVPILSGTIVQLFIKFNLVRLR
ncbi:MAG: hypothetical protein COU72_01955 [Parcubacteria group bacterium CG10_big_fil_rev_8_21_14_0_10_41_35]|nr:MAG: hypothetical protein COU72_01955 [Parcubacteria group bacterium CG10_big_fil_rev_8_21_14_0_10_41_35]